MQRDVPPRPLEATLSDTLYIVRSSDRSLAAFVELHKLWYIYY
jgi:hypothetical protein